MLRSATGRAYIAHCEDAKREAILDALRRTGRKGDLMAAVPEMVAEAIAITREQGFGLRDADFGGSYDEGRASHDDGRDSIGVPIIVGYSTVGAINITWAKKVLPRTQAIEHFVGPLQVAAREISEGLMEAQNSFNAARRCPEKFHRVKLWPQAIAGAGRSALASKRKKARSETHISQRGS